MPSSAPLIATGWIKLDQNAQFSIYIHTDGVQVLLKPGPPGKFFDDIPPTSGTGTGHLVFTSLLLAPQGTSFPAKLEFTPTQLTLTVEQNQGTFSVLSEKFFFRQLKVGFTQKKDQKLELQPNSSVTLMRENQAVPLLAKLDDKGLVFNSNPLAKPEELVFAPIGRAKLESVSLKANLKRWEGLQLLYNFGDAESDLIFDNSGISPGLHMNFRNVSKIQGGGLKLDRNSEVSTPVSTDRVLEAIVAKNEFTFELWLKPTAQQGTILALGNNPGTVFLQIEQTREGRVDISGTFSSISIPGPILVQGSMNHIVFLRDGLGNERIFLNGKEAFSRGGQEAIRKFGNVAVLTLGNRPKKDNAWQGEIFNLAIYNRALTESEIQSHFKPIVNMMGTFFINNAPRPLQEGLPAAFDIMKELPTIEVDTEKELFVREGLSFKKLVLHWEQVGKELWSLNGSVEASFWGKSVSLNAKLTGDSGKLQLELTQKQSPITINLDDWGELEFTQLSLNAALKSGSDWELKTSSQSPFVILPAIRFREFDLFADFLLEAPQLGLTEEHLVLKGSWLGEALAFRGQRGSESGGELTMIASLGFGMQTDFSVPPLFNSSTGVKINEGGNGLSSDIKLALALDRNGLLTKVDSGFHWEELSDPPVQHTTSVPQITLFTPPPNKNAILGHVVEALKSQVSELFAKTGANSLDFHLGKKTEANSSKPVIFLSQNGTLPAMGTENTSSLPKLLEKDEFIVSVPAVFTLLIKGDVSKLKISTGSENQSNINAAYFDFFKKIEDKKPLPGAIALLRRRIAEQLPLPYDQVLQYYYGWNQAENYLDLLPGMRLRVDFQNYQFVQAADNMASKGFVGNGSSHFMVHSYLHQNDGKAQYLLGFDSFFSRLNTKDDASISTVGAGGFFEVIQPHNRKAYFRLFYPSQAGKSAGPERVTTIVGANTLSELEASTTLMLTNGSVVNTDNLSSFFLRGKATIVPEIEVFVRDQPVFVPLGTSLRQLIERHANIPAAQLSGQDLKKYLGYARPLRTIHQGANSEASHVFINLDNYEVYDNGMDAFDLPLIAGDRFYF